MINIVSSDKFCNTKKRYFNEKDVPDGLFLEIDWLGMGRKLKANAKPTAELKDSESQFYFLRLFDITQTVPAKAKKTASRKLKDDAIASFINLFVEPFNHDSRYIKWSKSANRWYTINKNAKLLPWEAHFLRFCDVKAHIAGREQFGIFAPKQCLTRYVAIDLDNHAKDSPDKFKAMLIILCSTFPDWHLQVKEKDATGVHFIKCFNQPLPLDVVTSELRQQLCMLGDDYAKLEIYPSTTNGFRLPLSKGRTMLIDRPLTPVKNCRGNEVGDILGYIDWLNNNERQHMPVNEKIDYVLSRQKIRDYSPIISEKTPIIKRIVEKPVNEVVNVGKMQPLKFRLRRQLIDYWTGADTSAGILNPIIKMTARCLFYEVSCDDAIAIIERYCDELPDKSVSNKLCKKRHELSKDIVAVVNKVFSDNSAQPDPEQSTEIMAKVAVAFSKRGFKVSDKSTWLDKKHDFTLSDTEIQQVDRHILPILKIVVKDKVNFKVRPYRDYGQELTIACNLVVDILKTVFRYRHGEISHKLLNTIMLKHGIKLGESESKRTELMKKLELLDWVVVRTKKWLKRRATGYMLGDKMKYKACLSS